MIPKMAERDYILGTGDDEVARLGLQHHVWRPRMLECWRNAGITAGSHVMDVGAGPGYATVEFAELVGSSGKVIALERSGRFLRSAEEACERRGLSNVQFREIDLMIESVGHLDLDATWCRWVVSFVPSPAKLVANIAQALKPGGTAAFHEYVDYKTWRLAPRRPVVEAFVNEVMESWRASGGEPDIALSLPCLLREAGLHVRHVSPIVFAVHPHDPVWSWPSSFLEINLRRLLDLGRVDAAWADSVRREFRLAEADPLTLMITPMVLEIIAERNP